MRIYTRLFANAVICIGFLLAGRGAHAQHQMISGSGTSNFKNVMKDRQQQRSLKTSAKTMNMQKNFPKQQKTDAAFMTPGLWPNLPSVNNKSLALLLVGFGVPVYYTDSTGYGVPKDVYIPFHTLIAIDSLMDSADITIKINFGNGHDTVVHPHSFIMYDSVNSYYKCHSIVFYRYFQAGTYAPSCTVITPVDSMNSALSGGGQIQIINSPAPPSGIADIYGYSNQWCDSLVYQYSHTLTILTIYSTSIKSEYEPVAIHIDWGDGLDTTVNITVHDYFLQTYGIYEYALENEYDHVYSQSGPYIITFYVSFPDGSADTTAMETFVGSSCVLFEGDVFIDFNNNCIKDPGELGIADIWVTNACNIYVDSLPNWDCAYNTYYTTTDSLGHYSFYEMKLCNSFDSIYLQPSWSFYPVGSMPLICPVNDFYTITYDTSVSNLNFAFACNSGYDLKGFISAWRLRPGFQGTINPYFMNDACDSISGTAYLIIDNPGFLTIDSVVPPPTAIIGDSVVWNFTNLSIDDWWYASTVYVTLDTTANVGDSVCATLRIEPIIGDNDRSNNIVEDCFIVSNSWDPNEKESLPRSHDTAGPIAPDQELTYIIHFQNSGTDTAYNIYILDNLDPGLITGTFRIVGSSHYMELTRNGNNVEFDFPLIMLPDSGVNMLGSMGFVIYTIRPKPGLPDGSQLHNTAEIFFDLNPAVVTNTTLNTISYILSVADIEPEAGISVYPNPANNDIYIRLDNMSEGTNIKMCDMLGKNVYSSRMASSLMRIGVEDFAPGIYILSIQIRSKIYRYKLGISRK